MSFRVLCSMCVLAAMTVTTGCETLGGRSRQDAAMRRRTDMANLKATVSRLERQVEGLESGREVVFQQLDDIRKLLEEERRRTDERLARIDLTLNGESAAREQLRKSIISDLSNKISAIVARSTPAPRRSSGSGYEHIVKAGQTLSEIAAEYGVKTTVIVRENSLKNPNDIKVGQKLFIPD